MKTHNMDSVKDNVMVTLNKRLDYLRQFGMTHYAETLKITIKFIQDKTFAILNKKSQILMDGEWVVFLGDKAYVTDSFLEFDNITQTRLVVTECINYYGREYFKNKREFSRKDDERKVVMYTCSLIDIDLDGDKDLSKLPYSKLNEFKLVVYRNHVLQYEPIQNPIEYDDIVEYDISCDMIKSITYSSGLTIERLNKHIIFDKKTGKILNNKCVARKAYSDTIDTLIELS